MTRGTWVKQACNEAPRGRGFARRRGGNPLAMALAILALGTSVAFSACYKGDQSCSEAYNPNDPDDHCPYGPAGGPKLGQSAPKCPEVPKVPAEECNVGFPAVYARLEAADGGNCSSNGQGCHSYKIKGIEPFTDEQAMLDALAAYKGDVGRKYFDPEAPQKSWWVCNLRGDAGKLMPQNPTPRMNASDIALVEKWLGCGAPLTGGGAGGGSGGGGGQGGAGGGP